MRKDHPADPDGDTEQMQKQRDYDRVTHTADSLFWSWTAWPVHLAPDARAAGERTAFDRPARAQFRVRGILRFVHRARVACFTAGARNAALRGIIPCRGGRRAADADRIDQN
jgi:hypothetical protein